MKRNNKALYEQIMRNVSKQVKKTLNEGYCDLYPEKSDLVNLLDDIRSTSGDQMVLDEIIQILSYDQLLQLMKDLCQNWGENWFDEDEDDEEPVEPEDVIDFGYGPLG